MTADSLSIPAESLLHHRAFVQRLARSLVRDEHAAQDVVQETWLEALRHPPRSTSAVRAWLARVVRSRAQNVARGEARRSLRERAAAREEADESDHRLHERVAMQHKVVEAVLGLKDPYRTVVLLHYYEGLSPSAIAERRGAPAGTVRAQLSRAHDLLRERLDTEYGGERSVWCAGLAALARGRGASLAPKLAVLGAIGAAAAVPVLLWVSKPAAEPTAPVLALEAALDSRSVIETALPVAEPEPPSTPNARSAVPAEPTPPQILPKEELGAKSVRQLLQLALQVQQVLRTKLLTPSDAWKQSHATLLALPNTGIARVLHVKRYGTFESNALGLRGAGSSFSFATQKQGWDDEPDVELHEDTLRTQGWGPGVLDLGAGTLEDLPSSPEAAPTSLDVRGLQAWSLFWADAGLTDRGTSAEYQWRRGELRLGQPKLVQGHVYLVRGLSPGAHDLLAAMQLLAEDETGWTFAWRVLKTWPVQRNRGDVADPYWLAADPPESLGALGVDALVDLLDRIREAAKSKLYDVPADVRSRFASYLDGGERGVTRLLARGRYDPVVSGRGGGAYFSFATKQSDYDHEPDLGLDQGMYWSGFYGGNAGFLLDLGAIPIESVGDDAGRAPAGLADRDREAWDLIWRIAPLDEGRMGRAVSRTDEEAARRIELSGRAGPAVGHTYLVRSILPGEHDVLAVFTTAARDEHGDWIAWRVIWNRKLESDPKPR